MEGGRVKVHSLLSVVSSNPVEPGRVHKLSPLDQAMGHHTIHIVFYYGSNPFRDGPYPSDIDNLRVSLSKLLDEYPIVTGRLTRGPEGGWQVKCNDAGVRILQATVNTTMDEWLRSADASEERDLTVWEDMPEDPSFWSPFRIQINNFKCGGLAIGLSCTHMHADITSATMLIKSWAEVHSGQPLTHPPIFHLPPSPSSQRNSVPSSSASHTPTTPANIATVTMKFSSSVIENYLSQVQSQCPDATPFDVLVALFWPRIVRCQEPLFDSLKCSLSICVDSRSGGHPEVPFGYFGNALCLLVRYVDADKLLTGGLGQVCEHIHSHVAEVGADEHSKDGEGPVTVYSRRLTCINMEHMAGAENGAALMYAAAFRKGERPVHVSYRVGNVEGQGLIMVMPSAEGGLARTVTVVLPEEQIANICKDQAILELEPNMIMSGKR
ncbi:protein ECERIFERUM 2 [Sesamum alatum]|uniref:Protein ECERIFERUM 2 n=1 Tax=Sesamum alatum TaxID=300844 RepID=A0AAE1Y784_9LAMI|nr:protein ECERIFERUM 2 [Sesamum alatum]